MYWALLQYTHCYLAIAVSADHLFHPSPFTPYLAPPPMCAPPPYTTVPLQVELQNKFLASIGITVR